VKPVLHVDDMRVVDADALKRTSEETLVERAGTAVATWAVRMLGGTYGRHVVIVAGKGNNGADGRVAARRLRRRGARITMVDAADAPDRIGPAGTVDLVIDAAYGTGFRGTYRAPAVPPGVPVLAVDIPSGVNGDTGEACGEPLRADLTVTFAALKTGLLQSDGLLLAGRVEVADIGLDVSDAHMWVVEDSDVAALLAVRPRDAHKWQSAVAVVAGSPGMTGAAGLCARAAYRAGAGMVRLAVPGGDPSELPVSEAVGVCLPESGWASEALTMSERCRVLVVGPGLGRGAETVADVRDVGVRATVPVVIDADGLYALGTGDEIGEVVRAAPDEAGAGGEMRAVVLTPHDGEFARLAGGAPGPDRIAAATALADRCGAVVLLKGPTTVVANPGGEVLLATAGSPRLATAGTGDVLSGAIGAFVARGVAPHQAAALAAHVHGRAAELGPPEGLVAGDLADLFARWLSTVRRG
jgi:NAD(P)H-hydrate epimerase